MKETLIVTVVIAGLFLPFIIVSQIENQPDTRVIAVISIARMAGGIWLIGKIEEILTRNQK